MEFKAGSLVRARDRDWVVLPSNDDNLVILKPLGGSEDEITGIYLPLAFEEDTLQSTTFSLPSSADLGDVSSARLLYNAVRLSFRNGAGPFRSLAKLYVSMRMAKRLYKVLNIDPGLILEFS